VANNAQFGAGSGTFQYIPTLEAECWKHTQAMIMSIMRNGYGQREIKLDL